MTIFFECLILLSYAIFVYTIATDNVHDHKLRRHEDKSKSIIANCVNVSATDHPFGSQHPPSFMACLFCEDPVSKNFQLLNSNGKLNDRMLRGVKDGFKNVYDTNAWSSAAGGSGEGSSVENAHTADMILRIVVYKYGITRFLDAPCGSVSHSWMKIALESIHDDLFCFQYHGVDVVPLVIERNLNLFVNYSWMSFEEMDLSAPDAKLPSGYQLILSRDALQHLPYKYIAGVFRTYCQSGAHFLLVGSYLTSGYNRNIDEPGAYFSIDLLQSPFAFPKPHETFSENGGNHETRNKFLLLYRLTDLCPSPELTAFINTYDKN